MPTFNYKIKTLAGEIEKGTIESTDRYEAARELTSGGDTVITVKEKRAGFHFSLDAINLMLSRVSTQDKIMFAKNLGAMIDAGLSLSRALSVLERQTSSKKFEKVIGELEEGINKGETLSSAMQKHDKIFSSLFISMVHAGEESGNLGESLRTVSEQINKSYQLKKKIRGAMIYPAVVITIMVVIGILMMIYVVPTLTQTFEELSVDLPASTQFVIATSDLLVNNTLLVLGGLVALIVGLIMFFRTQRGKRILEFILLHLPIIAPLVKQTNSARTTRTLSSLLASGVDIVEAIEITRDVVQNSYYKEVLNAASEEIQKGGQLSAAFTRNEHLYPVLVGEMIQVGEETGELSEMLLNVADFYENEVDNATKNMTSVIEPFLMVIIGAAVGFFAISMISPMYSLTGSI